MDTQLALTPSAALAWAGAGGMVALAYFTTLRVQTRWLLAPGRRLAALGLLLARVAALVPLAVLAARGGALPLLLAATGFTVGRLVVVGGACAEGRRRRLDPTAQQG